MSYPQHLKDRFIEMRAAGLSFDKIASTLKVSKPTLLKWSEEFAKEIAAEEYIQAEALMVKHRLFRQARFEDAVAELARIRSAIKLRDLSKVNILALWEMEKQHKEEIAMMIADLQKHAGLNRDGQKHFITRAQIDEIMHEVLGVPIPQDSGISKKEDPENNLSPN